MTSTDASPPSPRSPRPRTVLVSGATGYVGGRLVPCLLQEGYAVRCFVRSPDRLDGMPWRGDVEVAQGDVLKPETLPEAMAGVDAAYYLIHSLGSGEDAFAERDRRAADNFGEAAREAGVGRIIYLGGIDPKGDRRSKHLQSRIETGKHLRQHGVPVTEFRAAVIVGSGSLSFEIIRSLVERLPVLICPRWVQTPTQPIAIRNVLEYLTEALAVPESAGEIIEIGGTDVLSYSDMFRIYAKVRGLGRIIVNVPFLTPRLSSHWIGLVTPFTNTVARPLIEGLDNEAVVEHGSKARALFPSIEPISYEAAVRLALRRYASGTVPTVWHSAMSSTKNGQRGLVEELETSEGMIRETRRLAVRASPEAAFHIVKSLGGETGWMYANALWRLRGYLDLLAGGIGYRKGRRDPQDVRVGDVIDFWRVEDVAHEAERKLLRLRAEMKTGGRAWLQFEVTPAEAATGPVRAHITQTAFFEPKGLFGILYWYALYVPHRFIFTGMIEEIGRRAEALDARQRRESEASSADAPVVHAGS